MLTTWWTRTAFDEQQPGLARRREELWQDRQKELAKDKSVGGRRGRRRVRLARRRRRVLQVTVGSFFTILVGLLTALITALVLSGSTALSHVRSSLIIHTFTVHGAAPAFLAGAGFSVGLVVTAGILVVVFSPVSRASGVPVTNAVLNGIEVPTFMNLSTLAVKAVGTLLVVAGGMPVGAQGPFSHVGAIVGGQICYLTRACTARVSTGCMSKTTAEKMRLAQFFNRATQLRTFVASGTAAGIAATFNTPITGVLFVHAESAAFWSKRASVRVFLCSMTVALCTSWWRNNFTGTMVGHLMLWNYSQGHWELLELFNFVAMGVVGGLLGAAVCRVHAAVDKRRHAISSSGRCQSLAHITELFVLSATVTAANFSLSFTGRCVPATALSARLLGENATSLAGFNCPPGTANPLAMLLLGGPVQSLNLLLDDNADLLGVGMLLIFGTTLLVLMSIFYGSYVPGGLFVPALLIGASYGRAFGLLLRTSVVFGNANLSLYALLGAGAVMSGMLRIKSPLAVMLIEATNDGSFVVPLIIVIYTANAIGALLSNPVYEAQLKAMHVPMLGEESTHPFFLMARHIMAPSVETVSEVEKVGILHSKITRTSHHAFP
eukprot:g5090.t1